MNLAHELQNKELHVDAYIQTTKSRNSDHNELRDLHLSEQGFPVHKILLASVSPFLKNIFENHYENHREHCVTILLPETSNEALYYVLLFIYTNSISIPSSLYFEVLSLSKMLNIQSLTEELENLKVFKLHNKLLLHKDFQKQKETTTSPNSHSVIYDECKRKPVYIGNILQVSSNSLSREGLSSNFKGNGSLFCYVPISKLNEVPSKNSDCCDLINVGTPLNISDVRYHRNSSENVLKIGSNIKTSNLSSKLNENFNEHGIQNILKIKNKDDHVSFLSQNLQQIDSDTKIVVPLKSVSQPSQTYVYQASTCIKSPNNSGFQTSEDICFLDSDIQQDFGCFGAKDKDEFASDKEQEQVDKLQVLLKDCEVVELNSTAFSQNSSVVNDSTFSNAVSFSDQKRPLVPNNVPNEELVNVRCEPADSTNRSDSLSSAVNVKTIKGLDRPLISMEFHNRKRKFRCDKCSFSSHVMSSLALHKRRKHRNDPLQCRFCPKTFKANCSSDLRTHEARHKSPSLSCQICQKMFKIKKDLKAHLMTHIKGKATFSCNECGKRLTTKRNLRSHVLKLHGTRKEFKCESCDRIFDNVKSFHLHKRVHPKASFNCPICRLVFPSHQLLSEHKRIHPNMIQHRCNVCKVAFRNAACLLIHSKIHAHSIQHFCDVCRENFESKDELLRHKLSHTMVKHNFKCPVCDKRFDNNEVFRDHMSDVHKIKVKVTKIS